MELFVYLFAVLFEEPESISQMTLCDILALAQVALAMMERKNYTERRPLSIPSDCSSSLALIECLQDLNYRSDEPM